MSQGYIPGEDGWQAQNGLFTGSLRLRYDTVYHPSSNKSTVTLTPQFRSSANMGNDYRFYDGTGSGSGGVYANGAKLYSLGANYGYGDYLSCGGATECWSDLNAHFSFSVSHDENGDAVFTAGAYGTVLSMYENETWPHRTLSPIGSTAAEPVTLHEDTASVIVSCPGAVETGSLFSLEMKQRSAAARHRAVFRAGDRELYTSEPFAASLSCPIPRSWFSSFPDADRLAVTVSVQTYTDQSCATTVGAPATAHLTVTADAGMAPVPAASGWYTFSPCNEGTPAAGINGYVKGYSRIKVSFDPGKISLENAAGAEIDSFYLHYRGQTVRENPALSPVTLSWMDTLTLGVTDSRGRFCAEGLRSLPVMDYQKPSLSGVSVFRCNAERQKDEEGTYISVKATRSFSSLDGQNSCTLQAAVAPSGGSYGPATNLTSGTAKRLGPLSADISYTVRILATDALGNTATRYVAVPTRKWIMKFRANGRGVAFGKAAESDDVFEVSPDWAVRLGRPLGIESGGTGAATAVQARANLGALGSDAFLMMDTAGGTTYTFSCTNGTRFVFFTSSANANAKTMSIFNTPNAGGNLTHTDVLAGAVSFDETVANQLKVTPANTGAMGFLVFKGKVTRVS